MTGFSLDPDTFGPIGQKLRAAGQDLSSAWQPLLAQTQGVQFGRGDDPLSPLIQAALQIMGGLVDDCVSTSVEALDSYADGLDRMATLFQDTETGTTGMFRA